MEPEQLRRYLRHGLMPQLAAFDAVMRLGSVTRASRALHMAQPTVSGHLRKLSDALGVRCSTATAAACCPPRRRTRCTKARATCSPRCTASNVRSRHGAKRRSRVAIARSVRDAAQPARPLCITRKDLTF